jgi:hypothetical protein
MGIYTIGAIFVLVLLFGGLGLVMLFVVKLDKRIDKRDRLGKASVYKPKKEDENKQ